MTEEVHNLYENLVAKNMRSQTERAKAQRLYSKMNVEAVLRTNNQLEESNR